MILMIITFYYKKSQIGPRNKYGTTMPNLNKMTSNASESKISKKKKKLSPSDILEIAGNFIVFFQLFAYSITIRDDRSIFESSGNNDEMIRKIKNAFSFLSFDINHNSMKLLSIPPAASKIIQLNIYFLIIILATMTEGLLILDFFKSKLGIERKKWFPKFQKTIEFFVKISEGLFIPISVTFFKIYNCAHETDNVLPFLEFYCELECWSPVHISLMTFLTILFLFYSIFFLIYLAKFKDIKTKSKSLQIGKSVLYSQSQIFFRMMVSGISILLAFDSELMASFNFVMFFSMLISSLKFRPYGKITKLNRLVLGLLLVLFLNSLLSLFALYIDLNQTLFFLGMQLS